MKVLILKKKSLIAGALVICFAIIFIVAMVNLIPSAAQAIAQASGTQASETQASETQASGKAATRTAAKTRKIPIYCVDRSDKTVSLSFDAAWGNEDTPTLINILNKHNVHATFFVVGQWVDKYPESVKALADAGNEVMNHSNTHPHMPKLSSAEMLSQITACDEKIEKLTGKRPILFRPPFGDYNNALIETLEGSKHYCIQWDVDGLVTEVKHNIC